MPECVLKKILLSLLKFLYVVFLDKTKKCGSTVLFIDTRHGMKLVSCAKLVSEMRNENIETKIAML